MPNRANGLMNKAQAKSSISVWDALADTKAEAADLKCRAELMRQLSASIRVSGTVADAARRSGITLPRLDDLLHGRISRFSLQALIGMAARLGRQVRVELIATADQEEHK